MKRNRIKWFVLGGLVLLAGTALADYNVLDKTTHFINAPTGLRTDETGRLMMINADSDRDFSSLENVFTAVTLAPGATFQTANAIDLSKFSRDALFLSFGTATAADSDSVRIGVRIWLKSSPSSGNQHLWQPLAGLSLADTCYKGGTVAADSGTGVGRCMEPLSFVVARPTSLYPSEGKFKFFLPATANNVYEGAAVAGAGRMRINAIPSLIRWSSWNGVVLNLSDNSGAHIAFPYAVIEVINMTLGVSLTNVHMDAWPRVN